MRKIIIISDYDKILSILNHFRPKHVPNPCDTLSDKLIEDIFSGSIHNLKKYADNKASDSIDEDNCKLLDKVQKRFGSSIMDLALMNIAKDLDDAYLSHIINCKEVWYLEGNHYLPKQITNNKTLYTKVPLFRSKVTAERGRELLLDFAKVLSMM